MNTFLSLLRKELIDAIRDKRSVMAGLYYAIFTPILISGLFMVMIDKLSSIEDFQLTIVNAEQAPDLIAHLNRQGISHSDDSAERLAIKLIIGSEYSRQMTRAEPADVILRADTSTDGVMTSVRRIQRALQQYSEEMSGIRLIARGINPQVVRPINLQLQNQATVESKGGVFIGMMVLLILLAVFIAGMNLAIDTSAGERERHSLALLLSHPIGLRELVMAKVCAVSTFGMAGLIAAVSVSKIIYPMVPWQKLGFSIDIGLPFILAAVLISVPVAALAASMQLYVSFMAKSFKEAQTYITFVMFIPVTLSYTVTLDIATEQLRWAPVTGQLQALIDLMKDQATPLLPLVSSCLATFAICVVLVLGMERLLKSEKIIFGL
ncbi:MAG: ABC transporter permease subunit [Porticoccaceae bacterium]|nr:ABC transporter permease subunit [Porticoccaceae bacterium]